MAGRGVLLHDLVELAHADVDLADRGHLLLRRRGDLLHQLRRVADHRHGPLQQVPGVLGDRDARLGQLADLLRGGLAPLGELADLARDDREPLALRARPGRLDRGVQGEQVRLVGDVLDDRDLLGDLPHRRDGLLHGLAPLLGLGAGLVGGPGRVLGVLGVAGDRGVDRLEARGDLLERAGLLGRPLGELLGAGVELLAGRRDRAGRARIWPTTSDRACR